MRLYFIFSSTLNFFVGSTDCQNKSLYYHLVSVEISIKSRTQAPPTMPAVKSTRALSLLDLPCELRLQIYELVFIQPRQPVLLVPRPQHPPSRGTDASKDKPSSLAILQTCTKINGEAAPLFYKLNQLLVSFDKPGPQIDSADPEYSTHWEKHGVTNLVGFLGSISSIRREAIKNIVVELHVKNSDPSSYKNGNFYLAWNLLRAYGPRMCFHPVTFYSTVPVLRKIEPTVTRARTTALCMIRQATEDARAVEREMGQGHTCT